MSTERNQGLSLNLDPQALAPLIRAVVRQTLAELQTDCRQMPANGRAAKNEPEAAAKLLSARETAAKLGVSKRTVFTLTKSGQLAAVRLGRSVRYDLRDIENWIERSKGRPTPAEDLTAGGSLG